MKEHVFKYPGDDADNNLADIIYLRLWILFRKIVKDNNDIVFNSMLCKSCGLIFTDPRFSEDEMKIKYDTINELGSVKYRLQKDPPVDLENRANKIYNLISD